MTTNIFDSREIMQHLLCFLSPISYIMLRRAVPIFVRRPKLFPTSSQLVMKLVEQLHLPPTIIECIKVGVITLTGGALLSLLQGEGVDLLVQDIDLAGVHRPDARFSEYPLDMTWLLGPLREFLVTRLTHDGEFDMTTYASIYLQGKRDIFAVEYLRSHLKASVIAVSSKRLLNQLPKDFDLSFCANTLCGDRLVICDWEAVLHKRCKLDIATYCEQIQDSVDLARLRAILYSRMEKRVTKYRERGYQVDLVVPSRKEIHFVPIRYWFPTERNAAAVLGWSRKIDQSESEYYQQAAELHQQKRLQVMEQVVRQFL